MGKKKKQFIDKKKSHHFYLMHRSQQDPLYHKDESEGGSKYILHPANHRTAQALASIDADQNDRSPSLRIISDQNASTSALFQNYGPKSSEVAQEIREVDELGLPLDGYDYHQHLAQISSNGTFITAAGKPISQTPPSDEQDANQGASLTSKPQLKLPKEALASAQEEQYDRMLDAITLKPESMDPDIRAMLELNDESAGEFDNDAADESKQNKDTLLDDDFMAQLMQEEQQGDGAETEEFDFDVHVARLLAEAEEEEEEGLEEGEGEEDIDVPGGIPSRQLRDIDEHFDALLEAQYADEDIGELLEPEEDPSLAGELDASDEQVVQALTEHLDTLRVDGGSENKVMEGNLRIPKDKRTEIVQSTLGGEKEVEDEKQFDMDDILSQSGYSTKPKPKWDCQTILSTLSTLDNHPTLIQNPTRRKPRKQTLTEVEEDHEDAAVEEFEPPPVDTSIPRNKKETPEEKRMRKRLVKEQKRLRRQQKKDTTEAFKQEKIRQVVAAQKLKHAAAPPEGVSTFRM